ncbi:hypothetical protein [Mycobacterium tuberculosis]|uniref:hypothetical protein n=1 Tax=Mycobacterium tuberculosis TaxID=1773 RepID=UPI00272CBF4B|nr:hypothetical protein [Mycobacterium tuberculosis]
MLDLVIFQPREGGAGCPCCQEFGWRFGSGEVLDLVIFQLPPLPGSPDSNFVGITNPKPDH